MLRRIVGRGLAATRRGDGGVRLLCTGIATTAVGEIAAYRVAVAIIAIRRSVERAGAVILAVIDSKHSTIAVAAVRRAIALLSGTGATEDCSTRASAVNRKSYRVVLWA